VTASATAFFDHGEVVVDGVRFVGSFSREDSEDGFPIRKRPDLIRQYVELCEQVPFQGIVELGVAAGGGVALLTLLARPMWMAAFELSPDPVPNLERFLHDRALGDQVEVLLGVDQTDADRLREVVERRLADAPLDLVVDDASHLYEPTVRSFEVLFPLLAPGGRYIIEDWNAALYAARLLAEQLEGGDPAEAARVRQAIEDAQRDAPREVPLPRLAMDLVLAASSAPTVVSRVEVDRYWVTVHRGPEAVDAATFTLAGLAADHLHLLG
jgi:predicted O-methyltransferase YrrM